MPTRSYGQYCGLARALEIVGERWGLLLVRDLLVGPRRFSDLRRGLPRIPTNVLSARLKELEEAGVVRRRVLPRPETGFVYELTDHGRGLEEAVAALGRWGARSLGRPREGEIVTADGIVIALRSTFRPEAARALRATFELRVGPVTVHAAVRAGALDVAPGPAASPDLVIETAGAVRAIMAGETTPAAALAAGDARIAGDPALFDRFAELFRIDPAPSAGD